MEKLLDNIQRLHGVRARNTFKKLWRQELEQCSTDPEHVFSPQQVRAVYFTAGLLLHAEESKVKHYDPTIENQLDLPFV